MPYLSSCRATRAYSPSAGTPHSRAQGRLLVVEVANEPTRTTQVSAAVHEFRLVAVGGVDVCRGAEVDEHCCVVDVPDHVIPAPVAVDDVVLEARGGRWCGRCPRGLFGRRVSDSIRMG